MSRYALTRSTWNRCTLGLKSISPTATQATLTIGRPALSHSSLMSLRSLTPASSGSAKMSIESNPISLVIRMPNAVSRPDWAQAELIRPSFMGGVLAWETAGNLGPYRTLRRLRIPKAEFEVGDEPLDLGGALVAHDGQFLRPVVRPGRLINDEVEQAVGAP